MPPQVNMCHIPQQHQDDGQQHQPQSETGQHEDEFLSTMEELRRQMSGLQNEMQRQSEWYEKERLQWEKEKQNMTSQMRQLQTSSELQISPEVEPKIEMCKSEDPFTVLYEGDVKLIEKNSCDKTTAPCGSSLSTILLREDGSDITQFKGEIRVENNEKITGDREEITLRNILNDQEARQRDSCVIWPLPAPHQVSGDGSSKQRQSAQDRSSESMQVPPQNFSFQGENGAIPFVSSPWTSEMISGTKPTTLHSNLEMGNPLADLESAVEQMLREYNSTTFFKDLNTPMPSQSEQQQTPNQSSAYSTDANFWFNLYTQFQSGLQQIPDQKIQQEPKHQVDPKAPVSVQQYLTPGVSQISAEQGAIKKRQTTDEKLKNARRQGIFDGVRNKQPYPSRIIGGTRAVVCETCFDNDKKIEESSNPTENTVSQTTQPAESPTTNVEPKANQTSKREQREATLTEFEKRKEEIVRSIEDMQAKLRQCETKTGKRQITLDYLKATKAKRVAFAELSIDVLVDSLSSLESWEPSDSEIPRDQQLLEVGRMRREYERIATYLESHTVEEAKLFHATAMSMKSGNAVPPEVDASLSQRQKEEAHQQKQKEVHQLKQSPSEIEQRVDELSSAVKELRLQTARLESDKSRWEEEIQSLKSQLSQQRLKLTDTNRDQVTTWAAQKNSESNSVKQKQPTTAIACPAISEHMRILLRKMEPKNKDDVSPRTPDTSSEWSTMNERRFDNCHEKIYENFPWTKRKQLDQLTLERKTDPIPVGDNPSTSKTSPGDGDTIRKGDNSTGNLVSLLPHQSEIPPVTMESANKISKGRDATKKKRRKHRSPYNFRGKIEELNRREAEEEKQQRLAYDKAVDLVEETKTFENNMTMLDVEQHCAGRNMIGFMYENFFDAKLKSFNKDTGRLIKKTMQDDELEIPPCTMPTAKPRSIADTIDWYV